MPNEIVDIRETTMPTLEENLPMWTGSIVFLYASSSPNDALLQMVAVELFGHKSTRWNLVITQEWNKLVEKTLTVFMYNTNEQLQRIYKHLQINKSKTFSIIDIETLVARLPRIDHVEVQVSNPIILG